MDKEDAKVLAGLSGGAVLGGISGMYVGVAIAAATGGTGAWAIVPCMKIGAGLGAMQGAKNPQSLTFPAMSAISKILGGP
jgi:hypothetical protein